MTKRIASIESFRILAILAVILMHSNFEASLSQFADGQFLVVLTGYLVWWVGVPYFLITAGYFSGNQYWQRGTPSLNFINTCLLLPGCSSAGCVSISSLRLIGLLRSFAKTCGSRFTLKP